jgi:hypothetical protein
VIDLPWIPENNIRPAMTWQWAEGAVPHMAKKMVDGVMAVLKENKVEKENIGIDNLDMPSLQDQGCGIGYQNGWPACPPPGWSKRALIG